MRQDDLPVFEAAYLLHVGDRPQPDGRRCRAGGTLGFEGNCLSASFSPGTWQEVAYIEKDRPIWRLEREDGRPFRLLDLTDAGSDPDAGHSSGRSGVMDGMLEEVATWGLETGQLRERTWLEIRYHRSRKDRDDVSRWERMTVPDVEAAYRVLRDSGLDPHGVGPDGKPIMRSDTRLTGTRAMADRLGVPLFCVDRNTHMPMSMATLLWAEEHLHGLDGAWWGDRYRFKEWAPRAGIFQKAVPSLEISMQSAPGWRMTAVEELEILAEMVPDHPAVASRGRAPRA